MTATEQQQQSATATAPINDTSATTTHHDSITKTTSPSVHSSSTDDTKSWDAQSTAEEASLETVATTPPQPQSIKEQEEEEEQQQQQKTAPPQSRRRGRGYTVTQKDIPATQHQQAPSTTAAPPPLQEEDQNDTSSSSNNDHQTNNDDDDDDDDDDSSSKEEIDWEFWSKVISDFDSVAKSERQTLSAHIQRGVPPSLRGMIWQLFARSKDPDLEERYLQLINEESVYEKAITRDLPRTFPNHPYFQSKAGQEALFNVVKAYSIHDNEVGYCQGISFIAGPLLLNMPEEEAFCVLVQLMNQYSLRGHFMPQLDLLHQRLYQFDGVLQDHLPHVHRHFETQGIKSSMYASQWFMTLFAYKFPIDFVFRIYDIILAEGGNSTNLEPLYSFGLALIQKNQPTILSLEFDNLVNYLKSDMLEAYNSDASELIRDAYLIKIAPKRFNRLAKEYRVEAARAHNEAEAIETLKKQNKALTETIRNLEGNVTELNNSLRI
ncbi:rab-GTPase-TBC domain-containing protein [Zychaea mexicana]|uniref:rab-GTPase-TBC domain-containing protein n=1 Tax=Zychaea mexicana TaxID=64656 RepID=UPI0022FF0A96|nr:rab-GTPase-TBC domain-containing protein [Zychaea mexicana]KAI9496909.1 rab-GTPase-TBC domain-containing protein [Zychaea mexicana]